MVVREKINQVYEIGYLLSPAVAEDQLGDTAAKLIIEPILQAAGVIVHEDKPSLISLAYPIRKTVEHRTMIFKTAYSGSIQFTAETDAVLGLLKGYRGTLEIVRFLLIERPSLPVRDPLAINRPETGEPVRADVKTEIKIDPAALDREIDQLLSPAG